jgi:radical SAM protein with 4Fe4S-binding SPASM domain
MINWNGDVVPCCRDTNGHNVFGNIFEKTLKEIWNGNEARSFRKKIIESKLILKINKNNLY